MERIRLSDDLEISRLVYGMWRLEDDADKTPGIVRDKIAACLDQGITTFDQADIYGGYMAEARLGAALTPELRARMEIVTKCGILIPAGRHAERVKIKHYDTSRAHIEASVEASLRLMGIETIDLLLIHRPDPLMDHGETGRALDDLVAAGKVRAVGASNFRPWDWELLQSAMTARLVTNQVELSLTAHAPLTNGDLAFHQRHGQPLMAWSPLGGGALMTGGGAVSDALDRVAERDGVDRAAVAVAWLLAHPSGVIPVLGTNNLDRIRAASRAFDVTMDRQTWYTLYTAALGREVA